MNQWLLEEALVELVDTTEQRSADKTNYDTLVAAAEARMQARLRKSPRG